MHFILWVLIGVLVGKRIDLINDPVHGNLGIIIMEVYMIAFLWWFVVLINHIYDLEIDKITNKQRILVQRYLSPSQLKQIAIIFGVAALSIGYLLGYVLIPVIISIILGIIYSIPPFRLRNSIFSTAFIGAGSTLAFFMGYFLPPYFSLYHKGIMVPILHAQFPNISAKIFLLGVIIFLMFTAGSAIKDIKDYEGDKKAGVKNIFTVYGIKKGINIASALLIIAFLCPLMLFHNKFDIIVFPLMGFIAVYLFRRVKRMDVVFLPYFLTLVYFIIRLMEFTTPT